MSDTPTYVHPEAFCLMAYGCERCHLIETLWNSRDGVTPFFLNCARCGGSMTHVMWGRDTRAVDHRLRPGERFFRDATADDLRAFYQRMADEGKLPADLDIEAAIAKRLTEHGEPPPWLDTQP